MAGETADHSGGIHHWVSAGDVRWLLRCCQVKHTMVERGPLGLTANWGMLLTQCKVLYVGNYLNPSFGPFSQVCCSITGFFCASRALRWHI